MANHGFCKTRKVMKPEDITVMFADMNARLFKGNLQVEYHIGDEHSWGPHVWVLEYISPEDQQKYASRVCWLNTRRSFEIRHGGGGDFDWWLDSAVLNEVAVRYNGTISDEGISDKWNGEPNKYDTFKSYVYRRYEHVTEANLKAYLIQDSVKWFAPPEFKWDTGPEITLNLQREVESHG